MTALREAYCYLTGKVYIDHHIRQRPYVRLLHISDTPRSFFPALSKLIKQLNPDYIVHTGDLVDNIKLALYPGSIYRYERDVKLLLTLLESSGAKQIYIATGNHDSFETLTRLAVRAEIFQTGGLVTLCGNRIAINHYPQLALAEDADIYLFGHDLTETTRVDQGKVLLNGISDINLIELESKEFYHFPYPWGTDDERSGKGRTSF